MVILVSMVKSSGHGDCGGLDDGEYFSLSS